MPFKAKNNTQITYEHLQNNFQKVQKMTFLAPKMVKMALSDGQNLTLNFDFMCHISTFQGKNTPVSQPFEAKNNA